MIQTHPQLKSTCEEYNSLFQENEFALLQKAYTTPHFLVLGIRLPGKSVVVYIGRGNQYQGIYLAEKMPPPHLRIRDRFLDFIRKHIVGSRISKFVCCEQKMIIKFSYKREGILQEFYLGWHERHLCFDQKELEAAGWPQVSLEEKVTNRIVEKIDDYLKKKNFEESKKVVLKKREKFLIKKLENIKKDYEKNKRWQEISELLEKDKIDFDPQEVVVCGEKIKFKGCKNQWQKKDLVYKKIKKLKRGEEILLQRIKETESERQSVQSGNVEFVLTKESAIQPCWPNQQKKEIKKSASENFKFFKIGNLDGIIGLNSSGNDSIRSGTDKNYFWFHLENLKGAHCILKTENVSDLTPQILSAISSMLRDFSRLEIFEMSVIYAQLKNVKGMKGKQGQVLVKKAKYLKCNYCDWKEIISV